MVFTYRLAPLEEALSIHWSHHSVIWFFSPLLHDHVASWKVWKRAFKMLPLWLSACACLWGGGSTTLPFPPPVTAISWLPDHCTAFFFCSLLVQLLQLGPIPDHVQLQPAAYKTKLYYPTQWSYDNNTCSKIKFKYTFLETSSQINNIVIVINLVA